MNISQEQLEQIMAMQGGGMGLDLEKKSKKKWKDCETWGDIFSFCYQNTKDQLKEKAYLIAPLITVVCVNGMYKDCKEMAEQSEIPIPTSLLFGAKLAQTVSPFPVSSS